MSLRSGPLAPVLDSKPRHAAHVVVIHPGVEVHFVEATAERLRRHIDSGDVQIGALPVGPDPFEGPLLYPVHVTLVVPRQHRLARRRTADVAELAGEPVLLLGHP